MVTLRDYQHDLMNDGRAALQSVNRVLLQLSTGGGKTRVANYMMERAAQKNKRSWFVVHQSELLQQTSRAFNENGLAHGILASGYEYNDAPVQLVSLQTVVNMLDGDLPRPDFLITDEAHRSAADSYLKITRWGGEKLKSIGLTATPERTDGKGLKAQYDVIVKGISMRELISRGYLCDYDVYAPPVSLDPSKQYADAVQSYLTLAAGEKCVAMCKTVVHARYVAAAYKSAGVNASYIDGTMSPDARAVILSEFEHGAMNVLCGVNLLTEGVDIPCVSVVQWLRNTDSLIIWLQGNGRGLRPHAGKKRLKILDHMGNIQKHGMICTERMWSLDGKEAREEAEKGDNFRARQCDGCAGWYVATRQCCPYCGKTPDVNSKAVVVLKGELQKLERDAFQVQQKKARIEEGWKGIVRQYMQKNPKTAAYAVACKKAKGKPSQEIIREMQRYVSEIASER